MVQKFLKFLLGFMIYVGVECQREVDKFESMLNQTLEDCRVMENATMEDLILLYRDDDVWPETKEGKCLIECFFEEVGIVSNLITLKHKINLTIHSSLGTINFTNVDFSALL